MSMRSPDGIDVNVGKMIRAQRLAVGMSLEKLARGIGVSYQQILKYEKGANQVGPNRLTKIAEALGVDVGFFFSDQTRADSELIKLVATVGAPELLRAFAAIKKSSTRTAVVALLQSIVESETNGRL